MINLRMVNRVVFAVNITHTFDSTAAYDDTVFWKYNPDFMRAKGNKACP